MAKREIKRIHCLIDDLPPDVRTELDEMLADTSWGYVAISAALAQKGYTISKSSIGRYAQRNGKTALRLREIREQAQQYAQLIEENQELDLAKVASNIYLQNLLARVVEAGDEEYSAIEMKDVGDQIARMLRTSVYEGRYTTRRKDDVDKAAELILTELRAELMTDPEMLERIQSKVYAAKATAAQKEASAE